MSSRKTATRRGTTKKRAQRATSNVFAMFNQDQIQEFKVSLIHILNIFSNIYIRFDFVRIWKVCAQMHIKNTPTRLLF